ncbi:MAG: hypothetical protein F4Z32_00510 [Gemmatimonadetes bacterium]|nr:hypothetical protein [Gemmatimonadota bacterium]
MQRTVPVIENVREDAERAALLLKRALARLDRFAQHEEEPDFDEAAPFYGEYLIALTLLKNGAKAAEGAHQLARKYLHQPGSLLCDKQQARPPVKKV